MLTAQACSQRLFPYSVIGGLTAVALIFFMDLAHPLGAAVGVLYVIPVLITLPIRDRRLTRAAAALCVILIISGYYLAPASSTAHFIVIENQILSLLMVAVAAVLGSRYIQTEHVLQATFQDLEKTVADRTEDLRSANRHLQSELEQRTILVREVHHRIKNNLQEIVGLVRQHVMEYPDSQDVVEPLIAQLRSVAVVHGLQAAAGHDEIRLCDMVAAISEAVKGLTQANIEPEAELNVAVPMQVREADAVPLALVLNELMLNAVKHNSDGGPNRYVHVVLRSGTHRAQVCITNTGSLPHGMDFNAHSGLGTGLNLVRSLLPSEAAQLRIFEGSGTVTAELWLDAPVIYPVEAAA